MVYLSVALSLVVIFIVYYYIRASHNFFKKHGILHTPPTLLVGNIGPLISGRYTIYEVAKRSYDIHPDAKYVGLYEFLSPILVIRDLELIKTITVRNFENFQDHQLFASKATDPLLNRMLFSLMGDEWREARITVTPTFTLSKIKAMFTLMSACATSFADSLSKLPEKEREIELKSLLSRYTNDVLASCAYGVSIDTMKDPNNLIYVYGRLAATFVGIKKSILMMVYRNAPRLGAFLRLRFVEKHISKFFNDMVIHTVQTRERNGIYRPDMIQYMMDIKNKKEAGKNMTVESICAHAFSFFFGGFDSVSTQACFVTHVLAEHQDVQAKVQEEVDEELERTNGELTYDVINRMKYLDAVINETMRLYPIIVFLERLCTKSFELPPALPGAKPFTVKPGMNVWMPVMSIYRDPKYFENPLKFDPDRFVQDGKKIINSGMYMPFGAGPRMCIGNRFAVMEIKVMICHLLARCDLKVGSKMVIPMEFEKGVFNVTAKSGFWVKLEPRKHVHPSLEVNEAANGVPNGVCEDRI